MSRRPTALEIRLTLARWAQVPPDDLDGYVIVLARKAEVIATLSNAADLATQISLLGRAVEHRAADVGQLEDQAAAQ